MRPPNWCWRQSSRIAGVGGPVKPTIMTAPISCWSVMPAGPRTASWLFLPAAGDVVGEARLSTVGFGVTEVAVVAARDPQPASTRIENRETARRMPAGSVQPQACPLPEGGISEGVTRHRINFQMPKVAGSHYAGTQPQNSKNPTSVSQYDVACFQVSH